jgi:hypothetical protein
MRKASEQNLARIEELAGLYQPLREAGDAELAKTASGRKLLKDTRALGSELSELYQSIESRQTPYEEGHRLAQRRQEEFRDKQQGQYLEAYVPHIRLQPSVEAVAQTLHPEIARHTVWKSEVDFLQAVLLQPTLAAMDLGTVAQGLGDPTPPQPVHSCLRPPYGHREEQFYNMSVVGGTVEADANINGDLFLNVNLFAAASVAQSVGAEAWVGGSFPVPAGITSYTVTVDYDYNILMDGFAVFGVAVSNFNMAVLTDMGDGGPPEKSPQSISTLIVPFAGGDSAHHEGNVRVTLPLTRSTSDQGTVKVFVGAGAHCDVWAFLGGGWCFAWCTVNEICLNSTV